MENVSVDAINDLHIREAPPDPNVKEIKTHLNVAKDTSFFYSGPDSYARKAKVWAKSKNKWLPNPW